MGKINEYFLIARNRLTNQFQVIPVNGKRGCSLEEIDLYTMNYKDAFDLEDSLQEQGIVTGDDTDFFIANQTRVEGKKKVFKQEALFSSHRILQDVAKNSLAKELSKSETLIDHILDSFAEKMRRDPVLFEQVVSGKTSVYEKYARYFFFTRQDLLGLKYRDGGWARTSYPLVRNVSEASSRGHDTLSRIGDRMYRDLLEPKLLEVTDANYDPNQMNFFDFMEIPKKINEDQLLEVMNTFENLPSYTITIHHSRASFHPETFSSYDGDDLDTLMTYLPHSLCLLIHLYLVQRDSVDSPEREKLLHNSEAEILRFIRNNPGVLEDAHEWCGVYHKYERKSFGDDHGREYQKEGNR